jgi:3',5'-cyclic AMP phosphodiesterase CpdA
MRKLVHLSDLHFGRIDADLPGPLADTIRQLDPHLLVVSGDLTQRARSHQFALARTFLDSLAMPRIVVPGNHDIPLHNLFDRMWRPLEKYRRHLGDEVEPEYLDDEIAVFGVNTARSLTFKDGRISHAQLARLEARLASLPASLSRVIVTHHPLDLPAQHDAADLVGRAPLAMKLLSTWRVDMLLAGHFHRSHAGDTAARYPANEYAALVVQAGTATSTRGRGESNSFNYIEIEQDRICVQRHEWDDRERAFLAQPTQAFARGEGHWARTTDATSSTPPPAAAGPDRQSF